MAPASSEMMKVPEVARYLRLTPRTVYDLLRDGKLPGVKVGHSWRVSPEGLMEFLQAGAKESRR